MNNVLLVIPAFNNHKTLRAVTEKALRTGLNILVVNDGSTDGGPETLDGLPVSRLDFKVNRGKGAAILSAADWAESNGFTHIITLDADGQHNPEDTSRFVDLIKENPWTIIIGNRQFNNAVRSSGRWGRHSPNRGIGIPTYGRVPGRNDLRTV